MTAICLRGVARLRPLLWLAAALVVAAAAPPALGGEPITVLLDQARILKLPERATTVVIGNPLIADLSLEPNGIAVVTGKGYGSTNFVAMDRSGAVLMEKILVVKGPSEPIVVVYRGVTRQTYSCTPQCAPRITLGDTGKDYFDKDTGIDTDFFKKTLDQTAIRNNQATAAGAGAQH